MIYIAGIGPGNAMLLTAEVMCILESCTCIIGTTRQLETVSKACVLDQNTEIITYQGKLETLFDKLQYALKRHTNICVLASGDPVFYGIGEWVKRTFSRQSVRYLSGISSAQTMFQRIDKPMHDVYMTSVHGRKPDWALWLSLKRLCILTDSVWTPNAIARGFLERGIDPMIIVGERLSYGDECITQAMASNLEESDYDMCVVVIEIEG